MASFYYSNPALGVGVSNLAEAMFGGRDQDVRMGIMGDQRRKLQSERRRLDAEVLAQEMQNWERQQATDSLPGMASSVAGATGLGDPQQQALREAITFSARAGSGSNAQQHAGSISQLLQSLMATGDEDQMRQSLVMRGRQPTDAFAGTTDRADSMIANDVAAQLGQATTVQGMRDASAMERALLQEQGRDVRAANQEAGRNVRGAERLAAGVGAGNRVPPQVTSSTVMDIQDAIGDHASFLGGEGYETSVDPASMPVLVQAISQLFQESRNLPVATQQGWDQVMGVDPEAETSGDAWWNPRKNRKVLRPRAPVDPQAAIAEAQAAIARGANAEAVLARLAEMGIDTSGLQK